MVDVRSGRKKAIWSFDASKIYDPEGDRLPRWTPCLTTLSGSGKQPSVTPARLMREKNRRDIDQDFISLHKNIRIDTHGNEQNQARYTYISLYLYMYRFPCVVGIFRRNDMIMCLATDVDEGEDQISGYFQGNLNGNFSVMVFNALLAIFTGSKPRQRERGWRSIEESHWTYYHHRLAKVSVLSYRLSVVPHRVVRWQPWDLPSSWYCTREETERETQQWIAWQEQRDSLSLDPLTTGNPILLS